MKRMALLLALAVSCTSASSGLSITRLYVRTQPPGAQVVVDSQTFGVSPRLLQVSPGGHVVKLVLKGYVTEQRRIDVPAMQITRLVVKLQKQPTPPTKPPSTKTSTVTGMLSKEVDRYLQDVLTKAGRQLGVAGPNEVAVVPPEYVLRVKNKAGGTAGTIKLGKTLGAEMDRVADSLLGQKVTVKLSPDGKVLRIKKADRKRAGTKTTPKPKLGPEAIGDQPVVGIQECDLFAARKLDKETATLAGGTQVSVEEEQKWEVRVRSAGGKIGWVRRCCLCSASEYRRRKKNEEVPLRVICIGAEKDGRTFLYGGTMPIGGGGFVTEAGQAFWMDESARGKTFTVASHPLTGDPHVLFLYKKGGNVAKLRIWRNVRASSTRPADKLGVGGDR